MKRILLVQPWNYHDEGVRNHDLSKEWRNGPFNIICLATYLKKFNVPVQVVDLQPVCVYKQGEKAACKRLLEEAVASFRPDIIGVSFFSYQIIEAKEIVAISRDAAKKSYLNPIIIAGGIHATVEPKQTVDILGFDYAFVGEGEKALLELANGKEPYEITGMTNGTGSYEKGQSIEDLDNLPFPEWQLCDYNFYTFPSSGKISRRKAKTLDLLMGRGCVNRCSFCAYSSMSKVRFHSAEYLLNELRYVKKTYSVDSAYFIDSSIGNNRRLLSELCEKIISSDLLDGFEWYANMRSNQVSEDLLRLMWRAGCRSLFYGFESGSQKMLNAMHKNCTVEQNVRAAELHAMLGFPYHASILLGFPGETETDIAETINFLKNTRPPYLGINWYVPLPGSDNYEDLKKNNLLDTNHPEQWRHLGEVLTSGKVYASIEEKRFRKLFSDVRAFAASIATNDTEKWIKCNRQSATVQIIENSISQKAAEGKSEMKSNEQKNETNSFEERLRDKWQEIPGTRQDRVFTRDMLAWTDSQILDFWEECKKQTAVYEVRGWFQEKYKDEFSGCALADIGPGIGIDGIFFAQHGAHVTFIDIVQDNLILLKRICTLKNIQAQFYYIDNFFEYHFNNKFDVFMAIGSLINAPFDFTKRQVSALDKFLKPDGKIIMLGYPKERYIQSGAKTCEEFAKTTDGERTPWIEWYDDEKVKALFGEEYKLNWSRNFGKDNIEFNWFDLTKKSKASAEKHSFEENDGLYANIGGPYNGKIKRIAVENLHRELGFSAPIDYPAASRNKPYSQWKMEIDDQPIFRYLYRNFQPNRHLEFGTWQGAGTTYCLEESKATVWTINPAFGEKTRAGKPAYSLYNEEVLAAKMWAKSIGMPDQDTYQTDSIGFIGRFYLQKQFGHRVCQIYCDSRLWDIQNYPSDFFDSALIDGGHTTAVVLSDTYKAFEVVRPGGLIMWHDFCPFATEHFESVRDVVNSLMPEQKWLEQKTKALFWIEPSCILLAIKL